MRGRNGLNLVQASVQAGKYGSVLFAVLIIFIPIYIIFNNAFKSLEEYGNTTVFTLADNFLNFDNFWNVLERGKFGRAFYNIGYILVVSVLGNILIGTMVAYIVGRFQFKLKPLVIGMYSVAVLIPTVTTQVATFSIIKSLGLFNTHFAPIILYAGTDILQIYIYLQFIRNIPYELDENAMMEGASLLKIYRIIIFPLLLPATMTNVILKTINIYNDMYIPYLYMPSQKMNVVSTVLMRFTEQNNSQWTLLCMAILIIIIPTVVIYLFLQRYIFSGIVGGAVK